MGVDWIPCRVEACCSSDELREHVRWEALHFRTNGSSRANTTVAGVALSDDERERIRQRYLELGPLDRKLLFKRDSHRVSVISTELLFPIEWRIAAERTILPWELSDQLAEWQSYREHVMRGGHRRLLQHLYVHAHLHELVAVTLANFIPGVEHSRMATASWAKRAGVAECRERILAEPLLTHPVTPRWPNDSGEADLSAVERAVDRVEAAVREWHAATRRGNVKHDLPRRPLPFEQWVAARLNDQWFTSFLAWVEPWRAGGYGLYRDCE